MNLLNAYRTLFVSALLCMLLPMSAQAASGAAGVVLLVSGEANAQATGQPARTLSRRADVFVGDRITTGNDSQLQLRMKDGAMIALGANADFSVKAYSDDAAGDSKDQAVLSLVKGGLRTISGQIDKSSYAMQTPTATLGIRGTVFDVYVRGDGSTVVILRDGQVLVTTADGQQLLLTKTGLATVVEPDKAPSLPGEAPEDVLDYLRGILPDLPDGITWEDDGKGGLVIKAGEDIINVINDYPPDLNGDGSVPGTPTGGESCDPRDFLCGCRQNPYGCEF